MCSIVTENKSFSDSEDDWQNDSACIVCAKSSKCIPFSETEDDFFLLVWILNDRDWPHSSACPCCSLGINHNNHTLGCHLIIDNQVCNSMYIFSLANQFLYSNFSLPFLGVQLHLYPLLQILQVNYPAYCNKDIWELGTLQQGGRGWGHRICLQFLTWLASGIVRTTLPCSIT